MLENRDSGVSRRSFLKWGLVAGGSLRTYHGVADQPIRLEFDQERLYLFDAESKRAL